MITSFRNFFKKSLQNQLITGSAVLFIGSSIASFGNYLFHLLMGRMLGPVDYGILSSLISLTYWFGVPMGALGLVVVRYVSSLRGKKEFGAISSFYFQLNKKLLVIGTAGFLLLLIVSPWLVSFLHFESSLPLFLIIISSLVGVYSTVNASFLQGFLRFGLMSVLGVVNILLKLLIAILLVYWGWRVLGAISAILATSLAGYLLAVFFILRLLEKPKEKKKMIDTREIVKYAIPVFFSTLAFTSLYTTDVVLVRHFLPAQEAGFYAALSTLGKIIVFASGPIVSVMFPLVSEHHANGKKYINIFGLSLGLVVLVCFGISLIYFLFPELMIRILFGNQYLAATPYLFLFAIFLSLYSLSSLLMNFYLSVKKVKVVVLPVIAALTQIVLIFLFHQNLFQVILACISILGLLFVSLLLYFFLDYVKDKKAFAFRHCPCL